jgi:hypothetical protein
VPENGKSLFDYLPADQDFATSAAAQSWRARIISSREMMPASR